MPNLQTVANVVVLDTKVLHNHVFIASRLGVRRETRRIDGADDLFVYVNIAKTRPSARGTPRDGGVRSAALSRTRHPAMAKETVSLETGTYP